jgi:hypothetical protein
VELHHCGLVPAPNRYTATGRPAGRDAGRHGRGEYEAARSLAGTPIPIAPPVRGSPAHAGSDYGLLWTTIAPLVSRVVPADRVGKALAIVFSGSSLSMASGAPVGTAPGALLGWRASFLFLAGFALLLMGLAL